jgi:hypothetical protein
MFQEFGSDSNQRVGKYTTRAEQVSFDDASLMGGRIFIPAQVASFARSYCFICTKLLLLLLPASSKDVETHQGHDHGSDKYTQAVARFDDSFIHVLDLGHDHVVRHVGRASRIHESNRVEGRHHGMPDFTSEPANYIVNVSVALGFENMGRAEKDRILTSRNSSRPGTHFAKCRGGSGELRVTGFSDLCECVRDLERDGKTSRMEGEGVEEGGRHFGSK